MGGRKLSMEEEIGMRDWKVERWLEGLVSSSNIIVARRLM